MTADGDLDLFVGTSSASVDNLNLHNFLYQNNCNGEFTRVTAIPGQVATDGGNTSGSSWVDIDNDGDLDLFVANNNEVSFLYKNDGGSAFEKITTGPLVTDVTAINGSSWVDYDNDGLVDAFTANDDGAFPNNSLYKNMGNATFTAITTGITVSDGGNSKMGAWADYDNDGDMDLYVVNRMLASGQRDNFLYRNDGGGNFTKLTTGVGPLVTDQNTSYDAQWADYDNDLDLDVCVVNRDFVGLGLGHHNLYNNHGSGIFTSVNPGGVFTTGVKTNGGISWGDYDNDGDLDLFITDFGSNLLYQNNGDAHSHQLRARL